MNSAKPEIVSSDSVNIKNDHYTENSTTNFLSPEELTKHIQGCVSNNRLSQKIIYTSFYGYAMTICDRYTNNHDDSVEIINDGFLKIFKELYRYKPAYADVMSSFKGWLRRIMIYTAIDHFRKNYKHRYAKELDKEVMWIASDAEDAIDRISYEEILKSAEELTPSYKMIFFLFIIEGFTHEEIAEQLGISIGASKSNLARARKQLQKILLKQNPIKINRRISRIESSPKTIAVH